jgi:hypothetical protein
MIDSHKHFVSNITGADQRLSITAPVFYCTYLFNYSYPVDLRHERKAYNKTTLETTIRQSLDSYLWFPKRHLEVFPDTDNFTNEGIIACYDVKQLLTLLGADTFLYQ